MVDFEIKFGLCFLPPLKLVVSVISYLHFRHSSALESTIVEANSRNQVRLINVRRIVDLLSRHRARSTCRRLLESGIFVIKGFGHLGILKFTDLSSIHRLFPLIVWDPGRIRFTSSNSLPWLHHLVSELDRKKFASFGELGFENLKFGVHRVHREVATSWEFRSISFWIKVRKVFEFLKICLQFNHATETSSTSSQCWCFVWKRRCWTNGAMN